MSNLTLTPISRDELPKVATRTNSASAGLFNEFVANAPGAIAQVNVPEDSKVEAVRSTLQNYVSRHDLPIKLFSRAGNLYMELLSPEDHATYKAEAAEKSARRKPRAKKGEAATNGDAPTEQPTAVDGEVVDAAMAEAGATDEG